MKRVLVLGIVLAGLLAGTAQATVIEGDPSGVFQRWTDEAKIDTPPDPITVRDGAPGECGYGTEDQAAPACAILPDGIIITRPDFINRFSFWHELGHDFDAQVLTEEDRARFLELIRLPGRPWDYSEPGVDIHKTSPREFFADAYAECAASGTDPTPPILRHVLPMKFGPTWIEGPIRWRQICRVIDGSLTSQAPRP